MARSNDQFHQPSLFAAAAASPDAAPQLPRTVDVKLDKDADGEPIVVSLIASHLDGCISELMRANQYAGVEKASATTRGFGGSPDLARRAPTAREYHRLLALAAFARASGIDLPVQLSGQDPTSIIPHRVRGNFNLFEALYAGLMQTKAEQREVEHRRSVLKARLAQKLGEQSLQT